MGKTKEDICLYMEKEVLRTYKRWPSCDKLSSKGNVLDWIWNHYKHKVERQDLRFIKKDAFELQAQIMQKLNLIIKKEIESAPFEFKRLFGEVENLMFYELRVLALIDNSYSQGMLAFEPFMGQADNLQATYEQVFIHSCQEIAGLPKTDFELWDYIQKQEGDWGETNEFIDYCWWVFKGIVIDKQRLGGVYTKDI